MEDIKLFEDKLVHLARMALTGQRQDVLLLLRRVANQLKTISPKVHSELSELLRTSPSYNSPLRGEMQSVPVDVDSRLHLVRIEAPVHLEVEPIWSETISTGLTQIVQERQSEQELRDANLEPTRTVIFTGPPGVGKSLAAKWVAEKLQRPLLTLDLSAVISSFLGKTGSNLRNVLDYAKGTPCVLLLDEFDSIAKRRDDSVEVGELKRLVTVLLQEIDAWPSTGILIAATNHPMLLDPAVWRRFDAQIDFTMPSPRQVEQTVELYAGGEINNSWKKTISHLFYGSSFSDIARALNKTKREAIVQRRTIDDCMLGLAKGRIDKLNKSERVSLAIQLMKNGFSQRQANEFTGVSRDTIRKKQGCF